MNDYFATDTAFVRELNRAFAAHLGRIVEPRMPSEPKPIPDDRSDETRDSLTTGV